MALGFRVQTVVFASGERFPLLVETATGIPLYYPTLFSISELRARNLASATLAQALRALMVLHQVMDHLGIDLQVRLHKGKVLGLDEIDCIARLCLLHQESLDSVLGAHLRAESRAMKSPVSLERLRMTMTSEKSQKNVASETAGIRLLYIRDYLGWLTKRHLLGLSASHPHFEGLASANANVTSAFSERIPSSGDRNVVYERRGISKEEKERLLSVVDPDSSENPWRNEHVRRRNQLIFHWLVKLGLRKGELLIVRLDDISFQANELLIARRPDNPEDPRKQAPNTKTRDRLLTLDAELADMTRHYILNERRLLPAARRHPFLFVATRTGSPLTLSAVNKLFVALRTEVPGLPEELAPHVMRHTWNDDFSDLMDEKGVSPKMEQRLRTQQMGWSERSKAAATYTRRHVERKAREASLALQEKVHPNKGREHEREAATTTSRKRSEAVAGHNKKRRDV